MPRLKRLLNLLVLLVIPHLVFQPALHAYVPEAVEETIEPEASFDEIMAFLEEIEGKDPEEFENAYKIQAAADRLADLVWQSVDPDDKERLAELKEEIEELHSEDEPIFELASSHGFAPISFANTGFHGYEEWQFVPCGWWSKKWKKTKKFLRKHKRAIIIGAAVVVAVVVVVATGGGASPGAAAGVAGVAGAVGSAMSGGSSQDTEATESFDIPAEPSSGGAAA